MNSNASSHHGAALITGASSGIGETFARRLAALGHSIILVARREDRLKVLASELRSKHSVAVEVIIADLAVETDIARIEEVIRSRKDLQILINNAGFGAGGLFYKIDLEPQLKMIQVHIVATTRLLRAALPQMVEQGNGAIINVASVAAYAAFATTGMYGATKAWMLAFTRAMADELHGAGVRIQALCPGFTRTGFHSTPTTKGFDHSEIPKFLWMSSDDVVTASLKALNQNQVVCIPGLVNRVMVAILRFRLGEAIARHFARKPKKLKRVP